jgi:protein-disulfide isomerase
MSKLSHDVDTEDHVQGDASAACTLVEYGDYQCPTCGEAEPIVKAVQKHFGKKLRFVFRNFPLEQHQFAEEAAETAEFAAREGKFWEMHDALFRNQTEFEDEVFPELAKQLGLKVEALDKALADGTFAARVERDLESGEESGVRGTPSFYINGKLLKGSFAYDDLVAAIEGSIKV